MKWFDITDEAKQQMTKMMSKNPGKYAIGLAVKGGGCAGFEYEWTTCNEEERGDVVLKDVLVVNRDFELYLLGTTLDWEKGAFKSEFTITNPNSKSSCGCGESFSI